MADHRLSERGALTQPTAPPLNAHTTERSPECQVVAGQTGSFRTFVFLGGRVQAPFFLKADKQGF